MILAIAQERYEILGTNTQFTPFVWCFVALLVPMALALVLSFPDHRPAEVALAAVATVGAYFVSALRLNWNDESFGYDVGKQWVVLWTGTFAAVMALASASTSAWLAVGLGKIRKLKECVPEH